MATNSRKMRVDKYIPTKLYGFAEDEEGRRVFFHVGNFDPGTAETFVPPIVGEEVEVEVDLLTNDHSPADVPRAQRVARRYPPTLVSGRVEAFYVTRGYGFARDEVGQVYYLHRSEVKDGIIPLVGSEVSFYVGSSSEHRPRACHITVRRAQ